MAGISNGGEDLSSLLARNDHLAILRYIRSHKLREPEMTIHHGRALLKSTLDDTSDSPSSSPMSIIGGLMGLSLNESETLAVLEQVCTAALDVYDDTLAKRCLAQIKKRVRNPDESARVMRLIGLSHESAGEIPEAFAVYDELLNDNPANSFALQRKYCILRSQVGKEAEAMDALNDCIGKNQGDAAGWLEMGRLCLDICDYKGAAFCYEELVVANPLDDTLHCMLGEIYATLGGLSNLKMARKHLAQSLDLCSSGGNLRALYALVAVAGSFLEESASARKRKEAEGDDVEVAKELVKYGAENLTKMYKGSRMSEAVAHVMEAQLADI